jgi:hypothetical protein
MCVWWTRTYQDVFAPRVGVVFDVESDEVLGESTVEGLVHLVEDEVEEVETRDKRRWEVDVARDREVHVVL